MSDTVSKTDNFLRAIEKYAEEQRNKIKSEAETFKEKELTKAEEEGLREAYSFIQHKMASIKTEISRELSKAESQSRREIFIRRMEIADEVFKRAEDKLIQFTKTDKYADFLKKSVRETAKYLKSDDVIIFVNENDMRFSEDIKSSFGNQCEVRPSEDITIGGISAQSRKLGLIADETLDTKLSEQREWFCENSGLHIAV